MPTSPARAGLVALADAAKADTVDREEEIDLIMTALVGRTHFFMLGKPGVAKSYVANRVLYRIADVRLYHTLLFPTLTDSAVLGPYSIPGLKNEQFKRVTTGRLPWCDVAMIDEIFNAGGALLQSLHDIINEREFEDNGRRVSVPLSTMICASNTTPKQEQQELAAIYDRIPLRKVVHPTLAPDQLRRMLALRVDPRPAPIVTWDDIRAAQKAAADLPISADAVEGIVSIVQGLIRAGITPSPRRVAQTQDVLRAVAWLDGADQVETAHLEILEHVFWAEEGQAATVAREVTEVCSPVGKEVVTLSDALALLADELDTVLGLDEKDPSREPRSVELYKKTKKGAQSLIDLEDRAKGTAAKRVQDTMRRIEALHGQVMGSCFGLPDGSFPDLRTMLAKGS